MVEGLIMMPEINITIRTKLDLATDELVEANKILFATVFPKQHSLSTHNAWIKKHHRCVYCDLGSKPVVDILMKNTETSVDK